LSENAPMRSFGDAGASEKNRVFIQALDKQSVEDRFWPNPDL
jgi:hypothetical protein